MEIDTIGNITLSINSALIFLDSGTELLAHNIAGTILPYFTSAGQVPDKLVADIAR